MKKVSLIILLAAIVLIAVPAYANAEEQEIDPAQIDIRDYYKPAYKDAVISAGSYDAPEPAGANSLETIDFGNGFVGYAVTINHPWTGPLKNFINDGFSVNDNELFALTITAESTLTSADLEYLDSVPYLMLLDLYESVTVTRVPDDFLANSDFIQLICMPSIQIGNNVLYDTEYLREAYFPYATIAGDNFLYSCDKLEVIYLPKVETFGSYLFYCGFSDLESEPQYNLDSARVFGDRAFFNTTHFETIYLPSAETFGDYAFINLGISIQSIILPEAISFGDYAFKQYPISKELYIPKVETFGNYAFSGIYTDITQTASITFTSDVTLGDYAFYDSFTLLSLTINGNVSFGDYAFSCCSNIETINISNATSFGDSAFYWLRDLRYVNLNNVEHFGNNAFYDCDKITTIALPKLSSIDGEMFTECRVFKKLIVPSVTSINCRAIDESNNSIKPILVLGCTIPSTTEEYISCFGSIFVPYHMIEAYDNDPADINGTSNDDYWFGHRIHSNYDFTGDGVIDSLDFVEMGKSYGTQSLLYDFNEDGIVNLFDFITLTNRLYGN